MMGTDLLAHCTPTPRAPSPLHLRTRSPGVLLHVIADALGSVSVICSSLLIIQYGESLHGVRILQKRARARVCVCVCVCVLLLLLVVVVVSCC